MVVLRECVSRVECDIEKMCQWIRCDCIQRVCRYDRVWLYRESVLGG